MAQQKGIPHSGDTFMFPDNKRAQILFRNDRLYEHQTISINYTTYDVRRDRDLLRSHGPKCDIMLPALDSEVDSKVTPFWYARILGIFHVILAGTVPLQRVDFLFVRWLGHEPGHISGWKARRLHRVGFVPADDPAAFGFVDPANVVRGVHLIPAFALGRTKELLGHSRLARGDDADDFD
ncbi:hypothetical protein PLICRDRAFT_103573 [Plicaturopsis crispa FD-325 SS-3]|nr:hypothetical protein PLICRDRAFT_103573 [Plicaturopsis crispa FD-325 SS-3]